MFREYREKLVQFGLSDKEAAVYIALLDIGSGTADQVAKAAKLNRSTTYVQIEDLMQVGLVSTFKKGKKTYFAAESPNNIDRLLHKKEVELELQRSEAKQLVPELMKIFASTGVRPAIRLFEGKEGLTSMRNEMLDSKPKEILIMTSIDQMRKIFTRDELAAFTQRREQNKTKSRVIYCMDTGDDFKPYTYQDLCRIDKQSLPFGSDLYIYNDTVSFASTEETIVGMTILNHDIAQTMRAIFESIWNQHAKH